MKCDFYFILYPVSGNILYMEELILLYGYVVMLTGTTSTLAYVSTNLAAVASTNDWSFTVTAGSGAVVNWTVVSVGNALINIPG